MHQSNRTNLISLAFGGKFLLLMAGIAEIRNYVVARWNRWWAY